MINTTTYRRTMPYTFQEIVAARGYHIHRNIAWDDAVPGQKVKVELETNEESRKIDPYRYPYRAKFQDMFTSF